MEIAKKKEEVELNPEQMKIAREASWLCNIFQNHEMSRQERKDIIKELVKEYKQRNARTI